MNQQLVWFYIKQRMKELGYENHSIEPFIVSVADASDVTLPDEGYYYYPCWVYRNIFTTAPGELITITSAEQSPLLGNFETWFQGSGIELKGEINIACSGFGRTISVEFLRVTIG